MPPKFQVISEGKAFSQSSQTKYKKTKFFEFLGEGTNSKYPSYLRPYEVIVDDESIYHDPQINAISKFSLDEKFLNPDLLDCALGMYNYTWARNCKMESEPRLLTFEEAVDGYDLVGGDKRTSSEGFEFKMRGIKKSDLYPPEGKRYTNNPILQKIEQEQKELYEEIQKGEIPYFVYYGFMKSEMVNPSKIAKGKGRHISGSDYKQVNMHKMLFGHIVSTAIRNSISNGFLMGINPYSRDWDSVANIFKVYDKVFDGDYSNFDGHLSTHLFILFEKWVESYYYNATPGERIARKACIWRMANSLHYIVRDGRGIIFKMRGSLPSGDFLTQFFGCFCNQVLIRYNYLMSWCVSIGKTHKSYDIRLHEKPRLDVLERSIFVAVLSDDHICGIREILFLFNAMIAQKNFTEMGHLYTSADKSDVIDYDFKVIEDCMLLRRRFVYMSDIRRFGSPIEMDSIITMLYWSENPEFIDQCIDTALQELGQKERKVHQEVVRKLMAHAKKKNHVISSPFIDYDVARKFVYNTSYAPWGEDLLEMA